MLTRCPACDTHFRVTADQLKLRAGRVRCGECQHVFNALDTLIEEAPVIVLPAAPTSYPGPETQPLPEGSLSEADVAVLPAPTIETPPGERPDSLQTRDEPPPVAAESPAEEIVASQSTPADAAQELGTSAHAPIDWAPAAVTDTSPDDAPAPPPPADTPESTAVDGEPWDDVFAEPPPPRRWPWIVGSLLAILALLAQAAFFYRVELAVLWPDLKPALVAACEPLGCRVGLPTKVTLVGIESSDLHPDAAQKNRLSLSAVLRNRAPFAQAFPHVEITLTDTGDKAILRKVLAPADYLPRGTVPETGMPPQADVAVNLALEVGALPASGYRLYIFYP